jgi:membrane protease YdiL (CAAX protease family)
VGLEWYAAALAIPVAVYAFGVSLNLVFGASASTEQQVAGWYLIFPTFAFSLLFPLGGAFGEELGWRGFALPRVQARLSALYAALIVGGVIQTSWHLPIFFWEPSSPPVPLILGYAGLGILSAWIFNNTRGSVLLTMVLHASFNTMAQFLAVGWWVAAIVVVIVAGPEHLSRKHTKQTPTPAETGTPTPRVA